MTGIWLVIAALLVLAAAMTGDFTLAALALAALAGAGTAAFTDIGALWQVAVVGVAAGILGPLLNRFLRPLLRGPDYGVAGSGAEAGLRTTVVRSGDRIGVRIKHDFFPARREDDQPLAEGDPVTVLRFEGITAIVEPAASTD
jgi:membrane protein implicated in regulation of membrane protease activity